MVIQLGAILFFNFETTRARSHQSATKRGNQHNQSTYITAAFLLYCGNPPPTTDTGNNVYARIDNTAYAEHGNTALPEDGRAV